MIAFTIFGLLVFWLFCFELGYVIALLCDARARIQFLLGETDRVAFDVVALVNALPKEPANV